MRKIICARFILLSWFVFLGCDQKEVVVPIDSDFNFDWKFVLGDIKDAEKISFNDKDWKSVRLPHDWSVASSFSKEIGAGATAFLPGGIGWYRKTFTLAKDQEDKITTINFDGIYNNSKIWINGTFLGNRPYGYVPFSYDLTPYLKYGDQKNVIAVRVDRSAYVDCRWYPGSGIYRNVTLRSYHKIHIPEWSTYITTPKVNSQKAEVFIDMNIENKDRLDTEIKLVINLLDQSKNEVARKETKVALKPHKSKKHTEKLSIPNPNLWDTKNPNLYEAKISLILNNQVLNQYSTTFGIRDIAYDAKKGFFLNGKKTIFKGVCLHHDGGLVGAAVPKGVWRRRLLLLKEAGCNAIRTAHNPPSEEFLDLCDELGFLVQDEAFDEWDNPKDKRNNYNQQKAEKVTSGYTKYFKEWSERDIKSMVMRDRNHPSVVMWSIGNEIEWTYPEYRTAPGYWQDDNQAKYYMDEPPYDLEKIKNNFKKADTAKHKLAVTASQLSQWVKEIDTTRPVTANLVIPSVSAFTGYTDALDIIGLSYRQSVYDYIHKRYPKKMILGTENWAQWHEWEQVLEKDYVNGIFLWTGISYMGESKKWPIKGSGSGLLDFAGFKRPQYHLFKTLWNPEPHLYLNTIPLKESPYDLVEGKVLSKKRKERWIPKWGWHKYKEHWNYTAKDTVIVEVITNAPRVELFLNEKSLGVQELQDNSKDRILKWPVVYEKGTLTAKALYPYAPSISSELKSSGAFAGISIHSDRRKLKADGYDVAHIEVELIDKSGIPFRTNDQEVVFLVEGNIKVLGVDNGAVDNIQDIQTNKIVTSNGRCLLIVQANTDTSEVTIQAKSGLVSSKKIIMSVE